jgi:tetratricopeptide (TPR) repeat protein
VVDLQVPPTTEVSQLAPGARAAKLREVVLELLRRALVVPTIVQVEHAHLMDAASAELFTALADELQSTSWLVLATRRDEAGGLELSDHPFTRIELTPLSREDVFRLALSSPEASQVPPHVVELAVERSGGSPEFLLDLLAAAAAGDREKLPESVGAATMARIDALDPRDGAVVRRAAILGINFHPRRLADVLEAGMTLPDDGFWERLSGVFAREPDGHVRFKRPALQEVAYDSLPFKLRRQLHLAVGQRLERDQDQEFDANPAILSHHFSLAGDQGRAHRYAMAAAKRATDAFSHADAAKLYRRAIDAARADGGTADPAVIAAAWEQLGEALRSAGEPGAAAHAYTEARRLLREDPLAQARLCHRHASAAHRGEAMSKAVRWLNRGLRCLDGLDTRQATASRAEMRSLLGGIRSMQGRSREAIRICRQAITEADSVGELRALAHAYYALDWALVGAGRSAEATYSWEALKIYEQLGDPEHEFVVLNNLGMFAYFDGRWDDAVALYRRAGEASERAGMPANAAYTDGNIGEILSDQGHLDEAEDHLHRARRTWNATRDRQNVTFADVLLARIEVRRGRHDRALPLLEAAMEELRRLKMDSAVVFAQAVMAEAEGFSGDPFHALEIASATLQANDQQRPLLTRVGGIALARLGQKEAAARELRLSLDVARKRGAEYDIAATIDALEAVADPDPELLGERDAILRRLRISQLPTPALT